MLDKIPNFDDMIALVRTVLYMTCGKSYALRLMKSTIWTAFGTAAARHGSMNTNTAEAENTLRPIRKGELHWFYGNTGKGRAGKI